MAELISPPTLTTEAALWARGYRVVAGLDEAGRGALAGPVVAAAVVVPPGSACDGVWAAVRDSKLLTPQARAGLMDAIQAAALTWGVGVVEAAVGVCGVGVVGPGSGAAGGVCGGVVV